MTTRVRAWGPMAVMLVVTGCEQKQKAPTQPPEPSKQAPGDAAVPTQTPPVVVDAMPPVAIDASAVAPPTEAQAREAALAWVSAASSRKADRVVAASALPFRLIDNYTKGGCGADQLVDADAIRAAVDCMKAGNLPAALGNTEHREIEASIAFPEVPSIVVARNDVWESVVAADRRASHAFVTVTSSHPKYPADVLYGVLSVSMTDTGPKVDGAVLLFSEEGE